MLAASWTSSSLCLPSSSSSSVHSRQYKYALCHAAHSYHTLYLTPVIKPALMSRVSSIHGCSHPFNISFSNSLGKSSCSRFSTSGSANLSVSQILDSLVIWVLTVISVLQGSSGEPGRQGRRVPVTNHQLSFANISGFTTRRAWILSDSECTEKELCKSSWRRTKEEKKAADPEAFRKM